MINLLGCKTPAALSSSDLGMGLGDFIQFIRSLA
jgi:hypothetical protein